MATSPQSSRAQGLEFTSAGPACSPHAARDQDIALLAKAWFGANVGLPADGKMFRAYDKATGEVVWEMELPGGVGATDDHMLDGNNISMAVG